MPDGNSGVPRHIASTADLPMRYSPAPTPFVTAAMRAPLDEVAAEKFTNAINREIAGLAIDIRAAVFLDDSNPNFPPRFLVCGCGRDQTDTKPQVRAGVPFPFTIAEAHEVFNEVWAQTERWHSGELVGNAESADLIVWPEVECAMQAHFAAVEQANIAACRAARPAQDAPRPLLHRFRQRFTKLLASYWVQVAVVLLIGHLYQATGFSAGVGIGLGVFAAMSLLASAIEPPRRSDTASSRRRIGGAGNRGRKDDGGTRREECRRGEHAAQPGRGYRTAL